MKGTKKDFIKKGIKFLLGQVDVHDMTRVAENAHFIQQREKGYAQKSIRQIVKEICSYDPEIAEKLYDEISQDHIKASVSYC